MFAVIRIPEFPLQARLRVPPRPDLLQAGDPAEAPPSAGQLSPEAPVALLELDGSEARGKARIVALTQAARLAGVKVGMTAAQGQARCGDLILLGRSEEDEREAATLLARVAGSRTPHFEETSPEVFTLDLTGALHWHRRERAEAFAQEIVAELAEPGNSLHARVGIARNPELALLAARLADPLDPVQILCPDGQEMEPRSEEEGEGTGGGAPPSLLGPLSIADLDPPPDIAMVLTLWGIDTVDGLLALPKDEVAERLGPEAVELWERASGGGARPLRLVRAEEDFSEEAEIEHGAETLEPLVFLLRRLLETLCARLTSHWLVAGEIRLLIRFDDGSEHRRTFLVPTPCCDIDLLLRMLHIHLEELTASSPAVGVRLEALPTTAGRCQPGLFEPGLRDPERFGQTLAKLEGLLGSGRVGTPELVDSHRPDAFRMTSFEEARISSPVPSARPTASIPTSPLQLGLPLRRFRPPLHAQVTEKAGCPLALRTATIPPISGSIEERSGPWRSSGDWWQVREARWDQREWDVQLGDGGLYRLAEGEKGWLLLGIYG